jgi:cobalt-zinc-cadmium efflux system protein
LSGDHHSHPGTTFDAAFKTGLIINILFIGLETAYGFMANSSALLADAGHNLSDVLSLAISWVALRLMQRKPTFRFTYGFGRSTILAALFNTLLLFMAAFLIGYEAIRSILFPRDVKSIEIMVIAAIGIGVNGFTAWLFMKGQKKDLNIRSAFLHFLADALVSFGVVVAGAIIFYTGWTIVDGITGLLVAVIIIISSIRLFLGSLHLALDSVPVNIDIGKIREYLLSLPEVEEIHDLHIWAMNTQQAALTVHLVTREATGNEFIGLIQHRLSHDFGVDHTTIQVESGENHITCIHHCN